MGFNVGEKVMVIDAQKNIPEMMSLIGHIVTIKRAKDGVYNIHEDSGYSWLESYFSDVIKENIEVSETEIEGLLNV